MRALIGIVYLLVLSDIIAGIIGAWALWGVRQGNWLVRNFTYVLMALCFEQVMLFASYSIQPPGNRRFAPAAFAVAIVGRAARSACIWNLVLSVVKLRQDGKG